MEGVTILAQVSGLSIFHILSSMAAGSGEGRVFVQ